MIELREYITQDGRTPFADWFHQLDSQAALKVHTYLTRIENENFSSLKPIKGSFQEVRIEWGPGYRVYAGRDGAKLIILLGGGTKKDQQKDIERAYGLWNEYRRSKQGN